MRPWNIKPDNRKSYTAPSKDDWYSSAQWLKRRDIHVRSNPWCVIGRRMGRYEAVQEVDHILPISHGGDRLAADNLQSLTKTRHSIKSTYERKEPIYEYDPHSPGLPLREWGKLVPVGKRPIVAVIGPSGAGKSSIIEAMQPRRYFDHVHHIDGSNWTDITGSLWSETGFHLLECTGAHFLFKKLLGDCRLSFYIIRVSVSPEEMIRRRGGTIPEAELLDSYNRQLPIPEDLRLRGVEDVETNARKILEELSFVPVEVMSQEFTNASDQNKQREMTNQNGIEKGM